MRAPEVWRDGADLDRHMKSPHIATALTAAADHLGGEIAIHPLQPVS